MSIPSNLNINKIEVYIINYNGKNTILSTIDSLYKSCGVQVTISVIDDHSTDHSPDLIRNKYPQIPVHVMPYNTKRANILRNKAMQMAKEEFVFITDNDLNYDPLCLNEMLKLMKSDEKIASCTPRFMYWDQPNKIYIAGTRVHFIGASISDLRDKIFDEKSDKTPTSNSGSGICLLRREVAVKVGGFDTNLLQGWGSDGEFYQRMMRAGYKCYYVPSAFALHEDKLNVTLRKSRATGQTYNRWVFILSHYSFSLIILLIPAFFLYELFLIPLVIAKGVLLQYIEGNFLVIKKIPFIIEKRKFIQSVKIVSDKEILHSGVIYVAPALIEKHNFIKKGVTFFSAILDSYWKIIIKFIP
jgi:GT2 family glycosyltransferase